EHERDAAAVAAGLRPAGFCAPQRHDPAVAAGFAVPANGFVVVVDEISVELTALRISAIAGKRAVGRVHNRADAMLAQDIECRMMVHRCALPYCRTRGARELDDEVNLTSARRPHSDFRCCGGGSEPPPPPPPPPSSPEPSSRPPPVRPRGALRCSRERDIAGRTRRGTGGRFFTQRRFRFGSKISDITSSISSIGVAHISLE